MSIVSSIQMGIEKLKELSNILNINEDDSTIKINFSGKVGNFKKLPTFPEFKDSIEKKHFSISVEYQEHLLTFTNLMTKGKFLQDEEMAIVNFHVDKNQHFYHTRKNILLYFYLDQFIETLKNKKLNFYAEDRIKKYIFLPINRSHDNGFIELHPVNLFDEKNFNPNNTLINSDHLKKRESVKDIFLDYTSTVQIPTPINFKFNDIDEILLQNAFNYLLVYLISTYLANKTTSNHSLIFKGYQNLQINTDDYFEPKNTSDFVAIFDFTYDKDKFVDKIEIVRNIFTIYLTDQEALSRIDSLIPKIRGTIDSHFTAYIQKQIKNFFDQRKDVVKEAYNAAIEAKEQADKVVSSVNLLILGLITAALTGIFAFSKGDKSIFIIAVILHFFYFLISSLVNHFNFKTKKPDIELKFQTYIEQFSILDESETDKIKKTYLTPSIKRLENWLKAYTWISVIVLIILLLISFIGNNYLNNNPTPKDKTPIKIENKQNSIHKN